MSTETGVFPVFYLDQVPDQAATEREGCPKFREVEKVKVHIAGDRHNVHVAKVTDLHRNRWPREYEAFKAGQEVPLEGTPLQEWPLLSATRIKELQVQNIRTVEDIAGLKDASLPALGLDGRKLQQQAIAWLEQAKDAAHATQLAAELSKRDDEIALLKHQLSELNAVIEDMKQPKRAKKDPEAA